MNKGINEYKFSFPIQTRWSDLDSLGHVNNALFVTYFEIARGSFMPNTCKGWDWKKDMFLIGHLDLSYHKELTLEAKEVKVHIKVGNIGNKSFDLEYILTSKTEETTLIHASGKTTQIMFDMNKKKSILIPDWVRKQLQEKG